MSDDPKHDDMSRLRVVLEIPGMQDVKIRHDVEFSTGEAGALGMDLYYPSIAVSGEQLPAVIFVTGYSDPGFEKFVGCKLKEMGAYISWAQLVAVSGMVAITYANENPQEDSLALLDHVRHNAAALGIDGERVGIWSCSGNVPTALSLLMNPGSSLCCAVLCYGYMLDLDGTTNVADASKRIGFADPNADRSLKDVPSEVPLFIARAGQDETPNLNQTIDRFVNGALLENLPVTLVNHAKAPHAFDINDDSERTRAIIREILAFMQGHLLKGD